MRLFSSGLLRIVVAGFVLFTCASHVAAQTNSQAEMLSELSRSVDWKTAKPQEALMAAAVLGNKAQAERALKRGAKINDYDPLFGYTPLILASQGPSLETIKYLISKGANVNARGTSSRMMNFPLRLSRHFMAIQPTSQSNTTDDLTEQMQQSFDYMKSMPPHWTAFRCEGSGVTPLITGRCHRFSDESALAFGKRRQS